MKIDSVDVVTANGATEEHKDAVGYEVGPAGELVVLYSVAELDQQGHLVNVPYPAMTYAPGWQKVTVQGARATVVQPVHITAERKRRFN